MNSMLSTILADVSLHSGGSGGLGNAMILLVAAVIVVAFLWWVVNGYVPEPMKKYAILVLVLLCVLALVNFVLSLGGGGFIHW